MRTFLSLAILLSGSLAMAADPESGTSGLSAWATGHVFAKIVPSLSIKEDVALNYGRILEGTYGILDISEMSGQVASQSSTLKVSPGLHRGEFTVTAPDFTDFSVDFDSGSTPNSTGSSKAITLTSGTNTMQVLARLYSKTQAGTPLPGSANAWKVYVGGALTVPEKAPVGLYTGTYKLVATYY